MEIKSERLFIRITRRYFEQRSVRNQFIDFNCRPLRGLETLARRLRRNQDVHALRYDASNVSPEQTREAAFDPDRVYGD